jgi:hypothetical protein
MSPDPHSADLLSYHDRSGLHFLLTMLWFAGARFVLKHDSRDLFALPSAISLLEIGRSSFALPNSMLTIILNRQLLLLLVMMCTRLSREVMAVHVTYCIGGCCDARAWKQNKCTYT